MKRSMSILTALLLSLAAFSCNRKNTGMDENNRVPEQKTPTTSDTTTPSTNPTIQKGTIPPLDRSDTSLSHPAPQTNCPDPNLPGYDAAKIDPECPQPGVEVLTPAAPTPSTTTTPVPESR